MANYLYRAFLLISPISSWLVISSIQGLTPAVCLAGIILILVVVKSVVNQTAPAAFFTAIRVTTIILVAVLTSQFFVAAFGAPNTNNLILIRPSEAFQPLRSTIFSQGLYLLFCIIFFSITLALYKKNYDRLLVAAGTLFAIYGFYELIYFYLFGSSGDFITNRVFGDGDEGSGSLFQSYNIAGITMQRLKSLSGEPSMYTFTVFPVLVLAINLKRYIQSTIIALSLLLTMSSTAVLVFVIYIISLSFIFKSIKPIFFSVIFVAVAASAFYPVVESLVKETVAKLALESFSGEDRLGSFFTHINYWLEAPAHIIFFGIGFGSIRSPDFLSTLLVNCGLVGFFFVTAIFLYPVFKLSSTSRSNCLKCSLICIYFMLMTSVSEYSYAMPWIFLGMSYAELSKQTIRVKKYSAPSGLEACLA